MISSFIIGALFILGHHLFYQSLHHQTTDNALLQQQFNTGIGTAFAFIVKMFLVIAVGTGYWQIFWLQVKKRPVSVGRLDVLNDLLENAWQFLSLKTLGRFPLLGLIAAITWLLPLAAIVPPAALTIELSPAPKETILQRNMPVLNFNNDQYAQIEQGGSGAGSTKLFGGPRYLVNRLSTATAASGGLLQFDSPGANSSYAVNFHAPALQCDDVPDNQRDVFTKNISAIMGCDITGRWRKDDDYCFIQPLYMAWAPNETNTVAFSGANGTNQDPPWQANTIGPDQSSDPAQFYIASQPTLENSAPWSFVGCKLYNATYELNVNFTNGNQDVNVTKLDFAEGIPYTSIFDIVGSASANGTDPISGDEAYIFTDLEQFAYQSLMDMVGRLINGQISVYFRGAAGGFNFSTSSTSVMQTALVDTPELRPVFDIAEVCGNGAAACGEDSTNKNLNITTPTNGTRLPQALEQLFQNMTLSLFSDNAFLTDKASSPLADVIIRSPQNRYVYIAWHLLVPYLTGLGISAIGLAFGFWALLANGVSYSQSFSTILRTIRHAQMDVQIEAKDLVGADPAPEYIYKARIRFDSIAGTGNDVELKQGKWSSSDHGTRVDGVA
jgi:hypothetical protein